MDLGSIFNKHVEQAVNKANRLLGLIRRADTYTDGNTLVKLFTSLIRPILEYANVAWSPILKRDQDLLENVQRRAKKLVAKIKHLSYTDRPRTLKLPSLFYRGDMIETYKYVHGFYNLFHMPLELETQTNTRGHSNKLKKERCTNRQRRNFFKHRTVNRWKTLSETVLSVPSLNSFKNRLDKCCSAHRYEQNTNFPPIRTDIRENRLTG